MIDSNCLKIEWIESVSKRYKKSDKILIEKTIRALYLLEQLKLTNLDFIFKGGTSLILLFGELKRLSIDIDIIVPEKTDLTSVLDKIIESSEFSKWEKQDRKTKSAIDKAHYKFYYIPVTSTRGDEEYILLDVLFENNPYGKFVFEIEINSPLLMSEGENSMVTVPLMDAILGDKLTAFAPNTTGVPYGVEKEVEIIKQMYDIGNLVDKVTDLSVITDVFNRISKTEIKYRDLKNLYAIDILDDIFQTALCISLRGQDGKGNFAELQKGIQNIVNFIISESFHLEKAITYSSKAAYISCLIKTGHSEIKLFSSPEEIKDWIIEQPFNTKLNKLKKSNPEAFYYWYLAINLIK